jgi:predicted glycosyltransferase
MAEITYDGGAPSRVVTFEELAELHDIIEYGPDWNCIDQIVVTLNRPSVAPHREKTPP